MANKKPAKGTMKQAKGSAAKKRRVVQKSRAVAARVKISGKTTRAKGHLGAITRRNQAKRDAKNAGS